jgi:hypothetical protein
MSPEWKTRILSLKKDSDEGATRFVELVDEAVNNCDLETTRTLMKTFTTDEDHGVQESVVSALSTANVKDFHLALLEELPRLYRDAPEWAGVLIKREATHNPDTLRQTADTMSAETKKLMIEILTGTGTQYCPKPFMTKVGS